MDKPVTFLWDGEAMLPEHRFRPLCDRQFVVGEKYKLAPVEDRSRNSHNHYFASLHEAWKNLPERLALRFPSAEHLRKYALIRCGYADSRSIVCKSDEDAERVAAFVRPLDSFAVVEVNGPVLTIYTAESQAMHSMGNRLFQQSKRDVLEFVSNLIGVEKERLEDEARRSAPHHQDERVRNPVEA